MTDLPSTVVVGAAGALAEGLGAALGLPFVHISCDQLDRAQLDLGDRLARGPIVWLHLAPASGAVDTDRLAESALLLRSAELAGSLSESVAAPVRFVAVLPAPGTFSGPRRIACDLALTTMTSLMRTHIAFWTSGGRRIAGVVYAGIEGNDTAGQRPLEEIRLRTPMGTLGSFEALASAVRFVGADASTYLSGVFLRVDGGCDAYSWVYPTRTI